MKEGPSIAPIAALAGDPGRANILSILMDGRALTASELAAVAGVTAQTASSHLAKLVERKLLTVEKRGPRRFYRLATPLVARMLEGLFPESVYRPVALHVAAKRYLCFIEPQYWDGLSAASQKSFVLQGGAFDAAQAAAFERASCWQDAVQLRRFDDMGKRAEISGRIFADFIPLMRELLGG